MFLWFFLSIINSYIFYNKADLQSEHSNKYNLIMQSLFVIRGQPIRQEAKTKFIFYEEHSHSWNISYIKSFVITMAQQHNKVTTRTSFPVDTRRTHWRIALFARISSFNANAGRNALKCRYCAAIPFTVDRGRIATKLVNDSDLNRELNQN